MADLDDFFPDEIALGAVWRPDWGTSVVETDGGFEVRRNRWSRPKSTFDVPLPLMELDDDALDALVALYAKAEGWLHTFKMRDWRDRSGGTVVRVRFATVMEVTAFATHLERVEQLTLIEVFA